MLEGRQVSPGRFADGDDRRVLQLPLDGDGVETLAQALDSPHHLDLVPAMKLGLEDGGGGEDADSVLTDPGGGDMLDGQGTGTLFECKCVFRASSS